MKVTIYDIAKALSISPSTVSRALANSELISDKVKEEIHAKAAEMGYKSRNFRPNRRKQLVIILPEVNNYFYARIVASIQKELGRSFLVSIHCSFNSHEKEASIVDNIDVNQVCCLLISKSMDSTNSDHLRAAEKRGIPIVMFNRVDYEYDCPKLVIDNYMDAYQLTNHLISTGYKNIAFAAKHFACPIYGERVQAYKDVLKKNNIRFKADNLIYSELTEEDVDEVIQRFLNLKERPDALILPGFSAALQAMATARIQNIQVPAEMAIVSFDEEPGSKYTTPTITGIERPLTDMGKEIAGIVQRICHSKPYEKNSLKVFKSNLVIRNSSLRVTQ